MAKKTYRVEDEKDRSSIKTYANYDNRRNIEYMNKMIDDRDLVANRRERERVRSTIENAFAQKAKRDYYQGRAAKGRQERQQKEEQEREANRRKTDHEGYMALELKKHKGKNSSGSIYKNTVFKDVEAPHHPANGHRNNFK